MRRRNHAPSAPPVRERDPLLEADREAERKYRELIREAEKLLVTVSRAPLEPPHNPRVRELRATEVRPETVSHVIENQYEVYGQSFSVPDRIFSEISIIGSEEIII